MVWLASSSPSRSFSLPMTDLRCCDAPDHRARTTRIADRGPAADPIEHGPRSMPRTTRLRSRGCPSAVPAHHVGTAFNRYRLRRRHTAAPAASSNFTYAPFWQRAILASGGPWRTASGGPGRRPQPPPNQRHKSGSRASCAAGTPHARQDRARNRSRSPIVRHCGQVEGEQGFAIPIVVGCAEHRQQAGRLVQA